MSLKRPRAVVFAASAVGLAVTGAWLGAGLKTGMQAKEKDKIVQEATVEEKIAMLEELKKPLLARKRGLEEKLQTLRKRQEAAGGVENVD